jgi:hypothetical protein
MVPPVRGPQRAWSQVLWRVRREARHVTGGAAPHRRRSSIKRCGSRCARGMRTGPGISERS